MNLLFADDDHILRKGYLDFLYIFFENIFEANDGEEALAVYKQNIIDLILIDINMPKKNGLDVIREIREKDKDVKVIVLSSYDDKDFLFKAIELNLVSYLTKPIQKDDFINVLIKTKKELRNAQNENVPLEEGFVWDNRHAVLYKDDESIKLTRLEVELFKTYCNAQNMVFSNMDIYNLLYEHDEYYNENKIRMLIKRLRKRLGKNIIENIYGLGYKFKVKKT